MFVKALVPSQVVEADINQMRVRCRNRPTQWVIPSSCLRVAGEGLRRKEAESDMQQFSKSESELHLNPEASEFVPSSGNF